MKLKPADLRHIRLLKVSQNTEIRDELTREGRAYMALWLFSHSICHGENVIYLDALTVCLPNPFITVRTRD